MESLFHIVLPPNKGSPLCCANQAHPYRHVCSSFCQPAFAWVELIENETEKGGSEPPFLLDLQVLIQAQKQQENKTLSVERDDWQGTKNEVGKEKKNSKRWFQDKTWFRPQLSLACFILYPLDRLSTVGWEVQAPKTQLWARRYGLYIKEICTVHADGIHGSSIPRGKGSYESPFGSLFSISSSFRWKQMFFHVLPEGPYSWSLGWWSSALPSSSTICPRH